eukprot:m.56561 g.56561  ORF g.56561 m.56561 type:complete len:74 (-) comp9308_c1_seq1:331-552(-)
MASPAELVRINQVDVFFNVGSVAMANLETISDHHCTIDSAGASKTGPRRTVQARGNREIRLAFEWTPNVNLLI